MSETVFALFAVILLAVFGTIGAYLIYVGIKNRELSQASEFWPTSGGTVLSSEIVSRTIRRTNKPTATHYLPKTRYSYRIAGTDYESDVIRFGDLERTNRSFAETLIGKYPAGATVAVRYDPEDPSRAVLETESAGGAQIRTGALFIIVPLIIVIVISLIIGFSEGMRKDFPPEVLEQLTQPN